MNIRTLRTVLLIQAIEESDRAGEVLPLADRAQATRECLRLAPESRTAGLGSGLTAADVALLTARAETLLAGVRRRSPALDYVLAGTAGLPWLGRAVLVLAALVGLSLSALDGSRRINILAFPLIGLIAWNFVVYGLLIAARFRGAAPPRVGNRWSSRLYERWVGARLERLLKQSKRFNAPLAASLRRFAGEWVAVEQPLLLQRAARLMHFAAALVATGLIAGLYVRGIALRYEAGWESTFLDAKSVRTVLEIVYGPGATLAGIGLPASDGIAALRWTGASGGGEAAGWIHLIALAAMLYIIVPRLMLACMAALRLARLSRAAPLPAAFIGYGRSVIASVAGGVSQGRATVVSFAYQPESASVAGLQTVVAATLGPGVTVELAAPVPYGQEGTVGASLVQAGAVSIAGVILLMTAASTPEAENHGAVISTLRDTAAHGSRPLPLLVLIDTGPYAARMHGDRSFDERLRQRCSVWSEFVAGYGLRACLMNLSRIVDDSAASAEAKELARACLWSPGGSW